MSLSPHLITFAGSDLTEIVDGQVRIYLQVIHGLYDGREVRGIDNTIPSLAGQVPRTRVGHQRIIEAEGFIAGVGDTESECLSDFVDIMDELSALLRNTKMPETLTVTREDGSTKSIEARPLNHLYGPPSIPTFRTISVEWLSVAPEWDADGS